MTTLEIYDERASQCRRDAAAAVLAQLRVTQAYRADEVVRKAEFSMAFK